MRFLSGLKDKQVGEIFEFGRYPQGANGEIMPITWRVLNRDSDALLVISEYGLDAKPFNKMDIDWGMMTRGIVLDRNKKLDPNVWSECSLRAWLNGEFMKDAFNESERDLIMPTELSNGSGEPSTKDKVFLLSIDEVENLSVDLVVKPTLYVINKCEYMREAYNSNGIALAWWWLRSRGDEGSEYAASVSIFGYVELKGSKVGYDFGTVRPALRIDLSKS